MIAVTAARAAGSMALLGFGIDSFVESFSVGTLLWRLRAERRDRSAAEIERLERRARKLVAVSLFLLTAWVAFDAARSLWERERPEASLVGIVLTTVSMSVMLWLGQAN